MFMVVKLVNVVYSIEGFVLSRLRIYSRVLK